MAESKASKGSSEEEFGVDAILGREFVDGVVGIDEFSRDFEQ